MAKTWSIISGTLPAGLALDSSRGAITGTPLETVETSLVVRVADTDYPELIDDRAFLIHFSESLLPLETSTIIMPSGTYDVAYSTSVVITGGRTPYTWVISSGELPDGVTLNESTGMISGTPTEYGSFEFTVTATSDDNQTLVKQYTIVITPPVPAITTAVIGIWTVNLARDITLVATGGTPGYTWGIVSGALPSGITLSAAGVLGGTPSGTGSRTVTIRVTDSIGMHNDHTYSVAVNPDMGFAAGLPVLGAPQMTRRINLVSTGITGRSPVLMNPVFVTIVHMYSTGIVAGSPVSGNPSIIVRSVMISRALICPAHEIDQPILTVTSIMVASELINYPIILGSPDISIIIVMQANEITCEYPIIGTPDIEVSAIVVAWSLILPSPVVGTPIITVISILTANSEVAGAPVLGTPVISITTPLTAQSLIGSTPVLGTPSIEIEVILTPSSILTGSPVLGNPVMIRRVDFTAVSLVSGSPVLGTPTANITTILNANPLLAGNPVFGNPVLVSVGTPAGIITGIPVLQSPTIVRRVDMSATSLVTGIPVLGQPSVDAVNISMTADNLVNSSPVLGVPAFTTIVNMNSQSLINESPVLGIPVLDIPIIITATGQYFSPIIEVADGASILWTFSDGSTSSSLTNDIDFGSNATRTHQLKVTPWSALRTLNIRYDGSDDGNITTPTQSYTPNHGLPSDSTDLAVITNITNLYLVRNNLRVLCVSYNDISDLDLSGFDQLYRLESYFGSIETINLEGCSSIRRLCIEHNSIATLDISDCSLIEDIRGSVNAMTYIEWPSVAANLWHICLGSNHYYDNPPFETYPGLRDIWMGGAYVDGKIKLTQQSLGSIILTYGYITELDLSEASFTNTVARTLSLNNACISSLILGEGCSNLEYLELTNTPLEYINIDNLTDPRILDFTNAKLTQPAMLSILTHLSGLSLNNRILRLAGNGPVSPAMVTTINTMISAGWTVTYDTPSTLVVVTETIPGGKVGQPYINFNLRANGGSCPYSWSVTSGSLPTGINLSSAGVLSGTPSISGSYSFTITVTDSLGATATISETVSIVSVQAVPANLLSIYKCNAINSGTLTDMLNRFDRTLDVSRLWAPDGHMYDTCLSPCEVHAYSPVQTDPASFTSGFTFTAWMYFLSESEGVIFGNGFQVNYHGGYLSVGWTNTASGYSKGRWMHVAVTVSSTRTEFYRDGKYINGQDSGNSDLSNIKLFAANSSDGYYLPAKVNDIHIWNKVCTAEEIQNCMNQVYVSDLLSISLFADSLTTENIVLGNPTITLEDLTMQKYVMILK